MTSFEIELTAITHGGAALGWHEGRVVFVPHTMPGETALVEIVEDKGRFAFAQLVEVLSPSADRVEAPCPYFGSGGCGGCQWQHIAYPTQLEYKVSILSDQLQRIGKIPDPDVHAALPDPSSWAYRNHAQFHPAVQGGLGFKTTDDRSVVDVESCMILHPLLVELHEALDLSIEGLRRLSLRAGTETGDRMIVFEMEDYVPPSLEVDVPVSCVLLLPDGEYANLIGSNHIVEHVGGHAYRVSAPSFFQVNTRQANRLVSQVLAYLDLSGNETVLDAFCGVGLFTVEIAQRASLVVAVESALSAVDDLMENTEHLDNVEVIEGLVEGVLPELEISIDAAVVDPPRAGMNRFALDALADMRPNRIVYVSCDPATLARDANRLTRKGYNLVQVQPIDMFPQTYHVESVSLFVA